MGGGDAVKDGFGLGPAVVADQGVSQFDPIVRHSLRICDDGLPCRHGLDIASGPDERRGKAPLQIDPFGIACQGALEIGDGLVRVGDCHHHVIEIALINHVDVLEDTVDLCVA